jgi:Xaa-Pro dipeptidase
MWQARLVKTVDELDCLAAAIDVAETALSSLIEAVAPGMTERQLVGLFAERVAELGTPVLASESVAFATPRQGPVLYRHAATHAAIEAGQLVVLTPSVLHLGYAGTVGRTWTTEPTEAHRRLAGRCRAGLQALVEECRADHSGADLQRAWRRTGEPASPVPLVYGLGLGVEPPLIGADVGAAAVLEAGSVVAVQSWVSEEGVGGFFEREVVLVGTGQPQMLSQFGRGVQA